MTLFVKGVPKGASSVCTKKQLHKATASCSTSPGVFTVLHFTTRLSPWAKVLHGHTVNCHITPCPSPPPCPPGPSNPPPTLKQHRAAHMVCRIVTCLSDTESVFSVPKQGSHHRQPQHPGTSPPGWVSHPGSVHSSRCSMRLCCRSSRVCSRSV